MRQLAIFADLDVLCAAPPDMIAAGYGDILAKYACLADWRLGQLLWGEDLDEPVVQAMQQALAAVAPQAESIGRAEPNAIAALMGGARCFRQRYGRRGQLAARLWR